MTNNNHSIFLTRCRELAREAEKTGNTAVGAIVVHDGIIVGEGIEATRPDNDITRHAEVEAIRQAIRRLNSSKLEGCSMYTTHEPCILCSYAIRHYRISWVGYETAVHTVGGASSAWPILTATNISVWGPPPEIFLLK